MKNQFPLVTVFLMASALSTIAQAADDYGLVTAAQGRAMRLTIPAAGSTAPKIRFEKDYYEAVPIAIGDEIKTGDIIKTEANAGIRIIYENGDSFHVAESTVVKMLIPPASSPANPELDLNDGSVRSIVSKDGPRNRLIIKTKTATMGVRGTDFTVGQGARSGTEVIVLRGQVAMKANAAGAAETMVPIGNTGKLPPFGAGAARAPDIDVNMIADAEFAKIDHDFAIDVSTDDLNRLPADKKQKIHSLEQTAVTMINKEIDDYGLGEVLNGAGASAGGGLASGAPRAASPAYGDTPAAKPGEPSNGQVGTMSAKPISNSGPGSNGSGHAYGLNKNNPVPKSPFFVKDLEMRNKIKSNVKAIVNKAKPVPHHPK